MMKNALALALSSVIIFVSGCSAPEIVPPDRSMKIYAPSGEPRSLPGFSNGQFIRNAEIIPYAGKLVNYKFGETRLLVGSAEYAIWRTSDKRPEGYAKDVTYTPKTCVLFFSFKNGERYQPGYAEQVLAVELPAAVMAESNSSKTYEFTFGPDKEDPRAVLYLESAPPEETERGLGMKSSDKVPEDFDGSPYKYFYRFYSEKPLSGKIAVTVLPGGIREGTLEITFPKNKFNDISTDAQGSDIPDWRNFTVSGEFRTKPVSK